MNLKMLPVICSAIVVFASPSEAAKRCAGNATAISIKLTHEYAMHGTNVLTAPNGCKMSCVAGNNHGRKRSCHWLS